jgi:RNA polymerase sigma-70 factor (ECF subfamily)
VTSAILADTVAARPTSDSVAKTGGALREDGAASAKLEAERTFLFGLCYRMTGAASDAEDVVQETFVRALEKPPRDVESALRPWLVRVAMNLSRDLLRRRKRRSYHGIWLPTPLETPDVAEVDLVASTDDSPEARYGLLESASFAFLVALEELTPSQRAVLLLRDVFDQSSREAADALGVTEENVRITLHRARAKMAAYDGDRRETKNLTEELAAMLGRLMMCVIARDADGARALLAPGARYLTDGGGKFHAAPKPVVGPERITKLYLGLSKNVSTEAKVSVRTVNGRPALVGEDLGAKRPNAPRFVLMVDLDREGKIRSVFSVIAPDKLERVRFPT